MALESLPSNGDRSSSLLVTGEGPDKWYTEYAWSRTRVGPGLTVRYFRCAFNAGPEQLRTFVIHVTADSRYRLWLNGERVGFGPAKGSLLRYHFETYDLGPRLRIGRNVLAAEVRWFGVNAPLNETHSPVPGWLVQGPAKGGVDTPGIWRVWDATGITPDTTPYISNASFFLNHLERVDAAEEPAQWREPDFDDQAWSAAVSAGPAEAHDAPWGVSAMRVLTPRPLPALLEEPRRFLRSIQDRREIPHLFGERPRGWKFPGGQGGVLLLDAGEYVTAFPELEFASGAGREIRVLYAEALGE